MGQNTALCKGNTSYIFTIRLLMFGTAQTFAFCGRSENLFTQSQLQIIESKRAAKKLRGFDSITMLWYYDQSTANHWLKRFADTELQFGISFGYWAVKTLVSSAVKLMSDSRSIRCLNVKWKKWKILLFIFHYQSACPLY